MLNELKQSIRVANVIRAIVGGAILLVVGALFAMTTLRYFQAKSDRPTYVTLATLSRGQTMVPTYFARVEGDALYDTGISFQYYLHGIPISQSYYSLLKLGDRLLLVYSADPLDEAATELTGSIYVIDAQTQGDIIDELIEAIPELGSTILPYVLDTADVRHAQWYIGAGALMVAALVGIALLTPAVQRLTNPGQDPTWRRLATYGKDIDATITEIEQDTQNGWRAGTVTVGNEWVISPGRHFTAIKLDDVVWIHKHTETQNINGIQMAIIRKAIIWDHHGQKLTITADENTTNALLQRLHARVPWAVTGYSTDIEIAWKKDRAMFLRTIAERRHNLALE